MKVRLIQHIQKTTPLIILKHIQKSMLVNIIFRKITQQTIQKITQPIMLKRIRECIRKTTTKITKRHIQKPTQKYMLAK